MATFLPPPSPPPPLPPPPSPLEYRIIIGIRTVQAISTSKKKNLLELPRMTDSATSSIRRILQNSLVLFNNVILDYSYHQHQLLYIKEMSKNKKTSST